MEQKQSLADKILIYLEHSDGPLTSGEIAAALGVKDGVTGRLAELYKRGKVRPVSANVRPIRWELGKGEAIPVDEPAAPVREVKKPGRQVWWIVDEPKGVFSSATAFRSESKARSFAKRVKGNLIEATERKKHNV